MSAKRKPQRSVMVRLLVLGVSLYMIITLVGLWNDLSDKKSELAVKNSQLDLKQSEITRLKELLEDGSESKIIEKAARDRLGYVYSDEQVFLDISGN